jgi:hypothetical protein
VRRRICLLTVALPCALAAAGPALALPHLSNSQKHEISTLVNRFVNDVVLRRDLADGWRLAGLDLRGGTTRKAWVGGREVPVQQFPVRGRNFRHAWYAVWATRQEIGLTVSLRVGHGANREMIEEKVVLAKQRGRWLVDAFYPDGIFRMGRGHSGSCVSSKCAVTGLYDFAPGPGGGGAASARPKLGSYWIWIILGGILGVPVSLLLGLGVYSGWQNRRARTAYTASRST